MAKELCWSQNQKLYTTENGKFLFWLKKERMVFMSLNARILKGCYTQGKTIDEALSNIREVIDLILEEKENRMILKNYRPVEISLHTITV